MTKYHHPSFTVGVGSQKYRDNWEETFGKKNKDTKCSFSEDCERETEEGKDWCNFHIKTEGPKDEPEAT